MEKVLYEFGFEFSSLNIIPLMIGIAFLIDSFSMMKAQKKGEEGRRREKKGEDILLLIR